MRIHLLSDLHLEFGPFDPPPVEADVTVLAGDTDRSLRGLEWARSAFPDRPVLYVAGNHEYYGKALPRLTEALQEESDEAVRFLENNGVKLGEIQFFGCTLWTDFQLHPNPSLSRMTAELRMNDYRKIRVSPQYRKLRVADTVQSHWRSREWLQAAASRGETRNAVIITHHAPSPRSLGEGIDDPLSPAYASDLEALIEATGAQLWIHGHTHLPMDYTIGCTRVVSNPRGYVDEPVKGFDPGLVVEVEP